MELWPLLALAFSGIGALIIGYNHRFKVDGAVMVVWRVLGVVPLALLSMLVVPWPRDVSFYVVGFLLGIGVVVADIFLMNAAARYGGRLSSMYVPLKMLLVFGLWIMVDPASADPLLQAPWKLAAVLGCFALAFYGMRHIRRDDFSWRAMLAVVPVAVIFAVEDVVQKYVLPGVDVATASEIIGASIAMISTMLVTGIVPVLVWRGWPPYVRRDVLASAGFGALLMSGISLLLVTFVLAPNPGYVAAITCLATAWLSLWARFRHGERTSMLAVLLLMVAAMGVALVTTS